MDAPTAQGAPAPTDEACAAMAQRGDKAAFGMLVERYQAKLLRYGRKFLAGREDIEDIVQDVFINVYRKINSFDTSQKFSPWIYRIAHNAFIDGMKKKSRSPFVLVDFDTLIAYSTHDESAERERDRQEMKSMIEKGLGDLSPKYREALILYYLEELSYKEIADVLQVPVGTVSARVKRAKDELRASYEAAHQQYGTIY